MRLESYVDMIMCGDDPKGKPKPDPHNALYICDKMGVCPSDTIMVGDTPADTLMGQQAALGLTVGVLTGVGDLHDLTDADVIVSDVTECVDMILPQSAHRDKPIVYQVRNLLDHGQVRIMYSSFSGDEQRHFQDRSAIVVASRIKLWVRHGQLLGLREAVVLDLRNLRDLGDGLRSRVQPHHCRGRIGRLCVSQSSLRRRVNYFDFLKITDYNSHTLKRNATRCNINFKNLPILLEILSETE